MDGADTRPRRRSTPAHAAAIVALWAASVAAFPAVGVAETAWVRVNQVGYLPDDPKIAVLSSERPLAGRFTVGEFAADIGADAGAWGPFAHNYRLDFSAVRKPGRYAVAFGDVRSPEFVIGADAYAAVPAKLLEFMRLQRCGDNPVTGLKCHQQDGIDVLTGARVDLTGGWHDAADRLKHMITTSYCVAALLLAGAQDEGQYGARLLPKLHPQPDTIYVQIGDDRDHLPPERLWHDDESDYGWGPGGPRAAWPATGRPEGPKYKNQSSGVANLAGRTAAALVLAGDVEKAKSLYRLAQAKPGCAMSVPVRAPHYYGESTFYDDLEWAATELFIATREPQYLKEAVAYAAQAASEPQWLGQTEQPATRAVGSGPAASQPARHGHYEFFPYVNLAHWRLYPHVDKEMQARLAGYYRGSLERARALAEQNPYRLGTPLVWCSTNDVTALATQAVLYEQMTGDPEFRGLAAEARDWIFGRNPWGVSFVIGVPAGGDAASRPHHLFYRVKGYLPAGGLVDGPVAKDINAGLKFADFGPDRLARFQSDVGVYHDVYEDFSTNEPIIDGTVSLLLLLRVWQ